MPALPELVVDDNTGTERFRLDCIVAERTDSLIEPWVATATVDRAAWLAASGSLDEVNDRVRIERGDSSTFFEGRFRTDNRDGNSVNVVIDSYERDAIDAQPTDGLELFQNVSDDTVFTDAIGDIPTLSAGTVETGATGLSFSFANAERSKQIRDAAEPFGMDIRYNFDRTVDFVQRLGADKPSVAISSTTQDIVDTLRVEDNSQDPVTHLRGLGAQQGDGQVSAEATIAGYTPGDRQVWREYVNKDIVNQSRLSEIVNRLITEYNNNRRRLKVEAGLVGVDVDLGDAITVDLPEDGINQLLRIVRLTERLSNEQKLIATLTNRSPERGGQRKRRDDLQRFNAGYQGFVDRDTDSYGWQPVTATTNATRPYPYPSDVVTERTAEVIVNSIPYRAYSSGGASGGGTIQTSDELQAPGLESILSIEPAGTTTLNAGDQVTYSGTIPSSYKGDFGLFLVEVQNTTDTRKPVEVQVFIDSSVPSYAVTSETYTFGLYAVSFTAANINDGDNVDFVIKNPPSASSSFTVDDAGTDLTLYQSVHTHDVTLPNHTHPADPGLTEFPAETASGCDLIVNGNTVATDIGTGEFTTTVDIAGELNAGDNTIELTSDSLGLVNLTVQTELFRQGTP